MNRFALAGIAVGLLCSTACTHHPSSQTSPATDSLAASDTATKTYFPIADELESEIRQIDSTPVAIRKTVISGGHKDSAFIKPSEFNALAMQFLPPELSDGRFEKNFTETSFMDNATHNATFTYASTNKDLSLQRVDLIATPEGGSHQVKSVYLERTRTSGDSSILDKMYWRSGKGFRVVSLINIKGGAPVQRQLIVSWQSGPGEDNE